jgi:hypothetical protein
MEPFYLVKNTFLDDFLDESMTHAADARKLRCLSEPPLRFNATATVQCAQIGKGWSWSRQATPESLLEQHGPDFSRSITEPVCGHPQDQIAFRWTKPKPFGNGNPGDSACINADIPACDTESSKECKTTPECNTIPECKKTPDSNLVDNMGSQLYQEGSCDNSAHEWDGLGMYKLSRLHAHEPHNLHHSNDGTSGACSAALCNSKYEPVGEHEPATSMHNDLWGPEITTVMIRRISRRYTQQMLVAEVANRGFDGFYNFLYLPWERKHGINMGFAFINFVEAKSAMEFKKAFSGLYLGSERSKPLCVHPAAVQGYQANHLHFMRTKVSQQQDSSYSPIFLDHRTMEQKQMLPPPVEMKPKKQMTEHWQYPDDGRKCHHANVLQTQSFTNEVACGESAPVQHQSSAAFALPRHAKKLRGRQRRAAAAAVKYPWSGEQNITFMENIMQCADIGNKQRPVGNHQKNLGDMHAVLGIIVLCLACGEPCGSEELSFCPCCSKQFKMQEDQNSLCSDWR